MAQSIPYRISAVFVAALRAALEPAGVVVKYNPRGPTPLRDGPRVVFFEAQSDGFIDQAGQVGKRRFRFAVGVINRTEGEAEAGADVDYVTAEAAIRGAYQDVAAMLASIKAQAGPLREGETSFRVDDIDVDGALVLIPFEIEYFRPKAAR